MSPIGYNGGTMSSPSQAPVPAGTHAPWDALLLAPHQNYNPDGSPRHAALDLSGVVPVGLRCIAQYLHGRGLTTRLLHLDRQEQLQERRGEPWDLDALLARHPATFVAIQCHWTLYIGGAVALARRYRRLHPGARIYLGGQCAAAMAPELLEHCPALDGVIQGEGEVPCEHLCRAALKGRDPTAISGAWHRLPDGTIHHAPPDADCLLPLAELPLEDPAAPPFEDLPWAPRVAATISRGRCPSPCVFCVGNQADFYPREAEVRPVAQVMEQLRLYLEHGVEEVLLGDLEFLSPGYMEELTAALGEARLPLSLQLETHPSLLLLPGMARRLVQAGVLRYALGAESGSDELLCRAGRRFRAEQVVRSVAEVTAAGGLAGTSWIVGLPGESEEDHRRTCQAMVEVVEAGGQVVWIDPLVVFPGTPLAREPERHGIELTRTSVQHWRRWARVAKEYVPPEELKQTPMRFFTHRDARFSPEQMAQRLTHCRQLARTLVPKMRQNARRALAERPELLEMELFVLGWYEAVGYQLLTF